MSDIINIEVTQGVIQSGSGTGDMTKAVYDPNTVNSDAFDMDNMAEGATTKILTDVERSAISTNTAKVGITPTQASDITTNNAKVSYPGAPEGTGVLSTGETGAVKFLREDGDGTCSWQVPSGSGDVSKVGTPINQQVGVWTGDGTIKGNTNLTFNDDDLSIKGTSIYYKIAHTGATGMVNGGGVLSVNADTTKFDITAGSGYVVDIFTDPDNPIITEVSWSAQTAITSTYVATNNLSWVLINSSGTVEQQATEPTREDHRNKIIVGVLVHPSTAITATADQSHSIDTYLAEDLANALGNINLSGNNFNPASTDLTIRRESGVSFCPNGNRALDAKNPNNCTSITDASVTFLYIYDDGSGGVSIIPSSTSIDPDQYDDGSGTLQAVSNNKWTNQYLYFNPSSNVVLVRYGIEEFSSLALAEAAEEDAPYEIGTGVTADLIRTVISIKKGETDLTSNDVGFHNTGRFGLGAGGGSLAGGVGSGDVVGPVSATDNAIARFDTISGKIIQNSSVLIDDSNNLSGVNDITLSGTVDGRNVAADGTKLDGISSGANVSKVGTPINNQIGVWTGDGTIEGTTKLTWDNSTSTLDLGVTSNISKVTSDTQDLLRYDSSDTSLKLLNNTLIIEDGGNVINDQGGFATTGGTSDDILTADGNTKSFIDDDTFATATATNIPSGESVKAYVDANVVIVSDTAYGVGWDGDTTNAASKNALYDKIETLQSSALSESVTITVSGDATLAYSDGMNVSDAGSDVTITVRLNATVAHPVNSIIPIMRRGAGNVILAYEGGVTGDSTQTYSLGDTLYLWQRTLDNWVVINKPIEQNVATSEFDLGANSIGGTAQSATGDGTTTIDWKLGNVFNFQFGAFNETFTFTAPTKPGTFILKLVQDSVGSRTATFPASVKWIDGTAPTLTTTATTGTDIITFYYDGTDYFAVEALNFS